MSSSLEGATAAPARRSLIRNLRLAPWPGQEALLRRMEEELPLRAFARGEDLSLRGEDGALLERALAFLREAGRNAREGRPMEDPEVRHALQELQGGGPGLPEERDASQLIYTTSKGKPVHAYTRGQRAYLEALREHDVTFAIGPAGTGKTYLAVAYALSCLKEARITRIVLVRPVVEAGERLGYLPGDLLEKVEPYLRPLYDAFYDLLSPDRFLRLMDKKVIEIVPLAYMRGRTLNDSFIILDEAQNTTPEQMKMFLTRMGMGSKAVVTGDVTQVDLPQGKESGLRTVEQILSGIPGIAFVRLAPTDVVRHAIVQKIVQAYEDYEGRRQ